MTEGNDSAPVPATRAPEGGGAVALLDSLRAVQEATPELLFVRGFLVSRDVPVFVPQGWATADLAHGYSLRWDERGAMSRVERGVVGLVVLGDAMSIDTPSHTNADVAASLCDALSESADRMLRLLDRVHGRYLVLFWDADGVRAVADATSMRAAFYALDGGIIAGHAALAGATAGAEREPVEIPVGVTRPGLTTPFVGIRTMPPNQVLDLDRGSLTRFWPREAPTTRRLEREARRARRMLVASLTGIVRRHDNVVVSLTAGLDSRATLAIVKAAKADDVEFFTYRRPESSASDKRDVAVATKLAASQHVRHRLMDYAPIDDAGLRRALLVNTFGAHSFGLAEAYRAEFSPDAVHVRSNLSETVRCVLMKKGQLEPWPSVVPEIAYALKTARRVGELDPALEAHIDEAIREADDLTHMDEATALVDRRDLTHWERKVATWHGRVVLESDVAFQTFSLYNSRAVLESLLSFPEQVRLSDAHLHEVIRIGSPGLLRVPVNGKKVQTVPFSPVARAKLRAGQWASSVRRRLLARG